MNAHTLLQNNILGVLATVNDDGSPRATPLHLFADDHTLYWFSKETAQHSLNIARDARVSISVFSPDESQGIAGVYIQGTALQLDAAGVNNATQIVTKRLGMLPKVYEGAAAYSLPLGTFDEQKSSGNCWYFYS